MAVNKCIYIYIICIYVYRVSLCLIYALRFWLLWSPSLIPERFGEPPAARSFADLELFISNSIQAP